MTGVQTCALPIWGRRWDATILAHVAVGRSIKSATGRDKIRGDKVGQRHGRAPVVAAADRNVVPQANWIDLLGLKLEPAQAPRGGAVIDRLEKVPAANWTV